MPISQLNRRKKGSPSTPATTREHYKRWNWPTITRILATVALVGALGVLALVGWISKDLPTPEGIARRIVAQDTKIYDRTGKILLYNIHGEEKRTPVEFKDIPDTLKQATIAVEDKNFYNHKGFQLRSMLRALIVDVLRGGRVQGGSTITQQFIKNAVVGGEKSYLRKIKEVVLAYQIERKFSKDEILNLYFNEIPYGSNAYGVEAASQSIFGKSVKDINLAESAILAALVKAPSHYSPWGSRKDELVSRQHFVLDLMANQGYITAEQAAEAKKTKLTFTSRREAIIAPHFVLYVKELLANKYGERQVEQGGLKVITTLDIDKQKMAETAIAESAKKNNSYKAQNASLVALDVPTNQILAMVGSRDFFDDANSGQVNVALRPRQPGSSFKPVVYTQAFSEGYTPNTVLFDLVTKFKTDTKDYTPHNYDSRERGPVTLRQALAGSLNIPAVKLLYLADKNKVLDLADRLGYTTLKDRSRFGLSLVLGGGEVTLLEHTAAYSTFAREGIHKPTSAILKVEDVRGNTLESYKENSGERIIDEEPVRNLTNILSDNDARSFIFGSVNRLTLPDRPVAAKTGTTNDYHDAWTLGYTPQLAVGVWVGNNNNSPMKRGADGSVVAAPIWQSFFKSAIAKESAVNFTPPTPTPSPKPILNGLYGQTVTIDAISGKLATDQTPPNLRITKLYNKYHTILNYITPGDPMGPAPTDPKKDPQYLAWELPIRAWAEAHGFYDMFPPTEYDNVHTPTNQPQISILSPQTGQIVTKTQLNIATAAEAPLGIKEVNFYIDGQLVGSSTNPPYSIMADISNLNNGFHTLRVLASDTADNNSEANTTFNLLAGVDNAATVTPRGNFTRPPNNTLLNSSNFPYSINLRLTGVENIKEAKLTATAAGGSVTILGINQTLGAELSFNWAYPTPDKYTLALTLTDSSNKSFIADQLQITIE